MAELRVVIKTNVNDVVATVERMAAHFETAPDDDPAKQAMAAFGEIVAARDLVFTSECDGGLVEVTALLSPELQRIADMVSG